MYCVFIFADFFENDHQADVFCESKVSCLEMIVLVSDCSSVDASFGMTCVGEE